MRGLHIVLKGLSDTLEHLLPFTLASLGWWLGIVSILFGPGATQMLFRIADPRIISELDRPGIRAGISQSPQELWSGVGSLGDRRCSRSSCCLRISPGQTATGRILIPIWLILLVSFSRDRA